MHVSESSAADLVSGLANGPDAFVLYEQTGGPIGDWFSPTGVNACGFDDNEGLFDYTDYTLAEGLGTSNTGPDTHCAGNGG